MVLMRKTKDNISTICGFIFSITTPLMVIEQVPANVKTWCAIISGITGSVIGYLTGKKSIGI